MEEAERPGVLGLELMPDQSREGPNQCRTQTTLTLLRQLAGFFTRSRGFGMNRLGIVWPLIPGMCFKTRAGPRAEMARRWGQRGLQSHIAKSNSILATLAAMHAREGR